MPGRRRSDDWYSPYFAPSTIVVGVVVIIVSISAGRYVGNMMIERDKGRYAPAAELVGPVASAAPTKVTHAVTARPGKLSPSAKVTH